MKKFFLYLLQIVIAVIIVMFLIPKQLKINVENQKKYVNALMEKGLHLQAVKEYQKLLDASNLSRRESANISYLIGNIYMEDLNDYDGALTSYLKVRIFDPKSPLNSETDQKIIECLERTGRSFAAQKEMDKLTLLKEPKPVSRGMVVANIGKREITIEELENQINKLPAYLQEIYKTKPRQMEFLKQYIYTELLYDGAKRRNYDRDKDIIEQAFQIKRSLMVQKLIEEEIKDKIKVSDSEVKLYYESHKKEFVENEKQKSLEEVKDKIIKILESEKAREAEKELIERMLKAEKVVIYEK